MSGKKHAQDLPYLPTRTARYFLSKFQTATLRGAIELAARRERERQLTGFEEFCSVPVDVEAIAQRKGFKIVEHPLVSSARDAELTPANEGFVVRLKPRVSEGRRRFTIAHEIGHSLFYEQGRHQVGLLDEKEMRAEEWICHQFASALLIPSDPLRKLFLPPKGTNPWRVLWLLDSVANRLKVSVEALVRRLACVRLSIEPVTILCLKYLKNQKTGTDPQLRILCLARQGIQNPLRTFWNRSSEGLGLHSALHLFETWREHLPEGREPSGGRYTWLPSSGLVRARRQVESFQAETLRFSIAENGHWREALVQVAVASVLYANPGCLDRDAYVISVLKQ